jgi:radical SAM protein with 4Fe4S-binding SPASM domain
MANLSITNVCNKKCVCCFANDTLAEFGKTPIDYKTCEKTLDSHDRLGMLFTNGPISEKIVDSLAAIPQKKISILLNTVHPIENIPGGTDGSFILCYPLNNLLKKKINDHIQAKDLIVTSEELLLPYHEAGIYPYCTKCPLFKILCNGGCMSFRIQRFTESNDFAWLNN